MRTLVAADEPPRRPPDRFTITTGNSSSNATVDAVVFAWLGAAPGVPPLTDWQAGVVSAAYGALSGPRGPFVATAGPAFAAGTVVRDVITGEILD